MSLCVRETNGNNREPYWNGWDFNVDDAIVQFCRDAFKKQYRSFWIYPVYMDDRYVHYTEDFFKEVGVELLPKLHKLPDCPRRPSGKNPYNHRGQLVNPKCRNLAEWDAWRDAMELYREEVWKIVWGDYNIHVSRGTSPKLVVVKGVRLPTGDEHFVSVNEVQKFRDDLPELE